MKLNDSCSKGDGSRLVLFTHGLKYEEGIAAAVISRAVLDAARGTPEQRHDAERFFAGSWFVDLCDFLGVPAERPALLGCISPEREYGP